MSHSRRRGQFRSALTAAATASALVVCLAPSAAAQDHSTDTTVNFSVSNITDFHGHIEQVVDTGDDGVPGTADDTVTEAGAATIAGMVDRLRAAEGIDGHIHTTSGDNVGGSAFTSALLDDEPTLEVLNEMGVDVSAVGNHEFDQGYEDLIGRISENSDYPILGANVTVEDGREELDAYDIQTITDEAGNSVDVAFIGTVTQNTADKVSPSAVEGITFANPWEVTNRIAAELSDDDEGNGEADVVIALLHEGTEPGQFTEDVDVVFAGDTHVQDSEWEGEQPIVLQNLEYGKLMSNVRFSFDTETEEVSMEPAVYTADEMATLAEPHAEVQATVDAAVVKAESAGAEVVAELEHSFTRGARGEEGPGSNRGVESTLNNLIAEAQRSYLEDFTGVEMDLGLMNAGGVRADLAAGDVTYKEAFDVQPFGNDLMYGTLTGADILTALEQQWQDPAAGRPRLALGVSDNFSYSYDPTAPDGERVIQATIDGVPLDPNADYQVAASTFLFEGGDGFTALQNARNSQNVGVVDVTAFIDYLSSTENVEPRWGQSDVGVSIDGDVVAGETVTVDLESLIYTIDPTATQVTVRIGDAEASAPIDVTVLDDEYGTSGRASVDITVPEDFSGAGEMTVTTDAGTEVVVPLVESEAPSDNSGSTPGSSAEAGPIGAVVAAIAALAGALGLANVFSGGQLLADFQDTVQRELNRLLG